MEKSSIQILELGHVVTTHNTYRKRRDKRVRLIITESQRRHNELHPYFTL